MTTIRHYQIGDEPVPGYFLTGFLGSGGFGEVWKSTAPGGTQVAIKIINLGMKGALKEFRSLKLVKKIHYPNLVPILAIWLKDSQGSLLAESAFEQVDTTDSQQFRGTMTTRKFAELNQSEAAELIIAMGLGHKSLADRLDECKRDGLTGIPLDELLGYMQDAARAIDYLNSPRHELDTADRAIQHCDIKPSNILIVGDAAQVCDFSLARMVDDVRKTSTAISPVYASPEVINSNTPSSSTDQYSLAVSYVELRTGELPFPPDATAITVITAHLDGQLDLSRLAPLERAVIQRATSRQPSHRYPSSGELVQALRRACYPEKVERRAWPAWLAAAALVLAFVGAGIWFTAGRELLDVRRELRLPAGFAAAPAAAMVDVRERRCPDQVICQLHELQIPLRLVNSRRTGAFYLMENKVSHAQFAAFVRENPEAVLDSPKWTEPCGGDSLSETERGQLPVLRVSCVAAAKFARWLNGSLPTVEQWDTASGRFEPVPAGEDPAHRGPFRQPLDPDKPQNLQIAVGRGSLGPLPVGAATHDESLPFHCRDMAGNGLEWTCSPRDASAQFSIDHPDELLSMILRGRSFWNPDPLRFSDLEDRTLDEVLRCGESTCEISFRVLFAFDDLP